MGLDLTNIIIGVPIGILAVFAGYAYYKDFERRSSFKLFLQDEFLQSLRYHDTPTGSEIGDLGQMIRVYENEQRNGFVTEESQLLKLKPLRTESIDVYWGTLFEGYRKGFDRELFISGLTIYILTEGTKMSANAYYLTNLSQKSPHFSA